MLLDPSLIGSSPGAAGVPSMDAQMIDLDATIVPDAEYAKIEDKWREMLLERFPFLTATVGQAAVPLDAREVTIRNEESNWGNFVVDQMRGAFGKPPADLARAMPDKNTPVGLQDLPLRQGQLIAQG